MESWRQAGLSLHEAWEAAKEQEPDEAEEEPNNPAYDALVEMNADLDRIDRERD